MVSFYPHTYEQGLEDLKRARDIKAGRPIEHATRLVMTADGNPAVRHHATNIVEYLPNGDRVLANGGWNSPTTMQRMRAYGSRHAFSIRGSWFVLLEPDANDPDPGWPHRTIPRPFTVEDPGPEPVKSVDGCIAGTSEFYSYSDDVLVWEDIGEGPRPTDFIIRRSDYRGVYVRRAHNDIIFHGEKHRAQEDEWLSAFTNGASRRNYSGDPKGITYKQCPHCAAFDIEHGEWSRIANGHWGDRCPGVGYNIYKSFNTMQKYLTEFGSMEAWQEAYITEFREVRAERAVKKEWDERNRVPFHDGLIVNSDGYAYRPDPKHERKLARYRKKVEKIEKQINEFVNKAVTALAAGEIAMPGGGDCWFCSMFDAVPSRESDEWAERGKSLEPLNTEARAHNNEHLWSHMEEDYFVPSLFVNALRERGYKDAGIYMILGMNPEAGTMGGERYHRDDSVRRDLRNYLKKRLIPQPPTK